MKRVSLALFLICLAVHISAAESNKYSLCDDSARQLLDKANISFKYSTITSDCFLSANSFSFELIDFSCVQESNTENVNIPSKAVAAVVSATMPKFVLVAIYKRGPYIFAYWSSKESITLYELNSFLVHHSLIGLPLVTIHDDEGTYLWGHISL